MPHECIFIAMVHGLNPKANVMGAEKLRSMVKEERQKFHEKVIDDLSSAKIPIPIKFLMFVYSFSYKMARHKTQLSHGTVMNFKHRPFKLNCISNIVVNISFCI
jgi:hypothetical protein